MNKLIKTFLLLTLFVFGGCAGYTSGFPYPEEVKTVYVEMFDSQSFRRGLEYDLTDALCKQIEVQTPYKIVSERAIADSVIYGRIEQVNELVLGTDTETGYAIQNEVNVSLTYSWKNLITGRMYANDMSITASAPYAMGSADSQTRDYAGTVAVNKAAEKIVESMQIDW
ncbi:MAG: LPS assembly lipoprotein LptE [Phycisphaerae bacterium]|jgi:hypothetical protein